MKQVLTQGRIPLGRTRILCILSGIVLVTCIAAGLVLDRIFPLPLSQQPLATIVLDQGGIPLRAFADSNGVWRFPARPDQVSPLYLEALLAYEDQWFYYHPGINPFALARAMVQNIVHGRVVSGGSTLTMQVARILDHKGPGPSLGRKFGQMLRAVQLEAHLTKDEILGLYLTHAPFGANIQGVRAGAFTWLGKDTAELTRAEAALLAVLPQAPSRYRPDRHPLRAQKARNKVLERLARFNIWSRTQVESARQEPVIPFRFPSPLAAPLAARRLRAQIPGQGVIHSLLDYELQVHLAELVKTYMVSLPPGQSGAVMVVNHKTNGVKAYVGSGDFFSPSCQGHVDMVQAFRSPGSTLKPFIYGLAMDAGLVHSHSMLLDLPRFGKSYDPGNFTRGFAGPVTVTRALRDSLNLPAVQVLEAYGPARFHDRLKNGGARFKFKGQPNLSMALGGVGTNLESLVILYSALARNGVAARPRLTPSDPVKERYLMSPGAAWIIRKILSRPLPGREGVVRLSGALPVAWKTGTSYGFRDAWAMGIKGDYLVGVWIGRPDGSPSPGQYGAVTAVPLMARVMECLPRSPTKAVPPDSVSRESICWPSGRAESRMRNQAVGACARRHKAWILDQKFPSTLTGEIGICAPLVRTLWVDTEGRRATPLCGGVKKMAVSLWPWQAEPFIPAQWQRSNIIPGDADACPGLAPLVLPRIRIVSLSDGSILSCQPGEKNRARLPLKALGGRGEIHWFLNQKVLVRGGANASMSIPLPGPGDYQLVAMDATGNSGRVNFRVIASPP